MTDSTILSREVAVRCWRTIGEVAWASERRELEPILHRARETGGTDSEDVARHLFFEESRKAVAERLLRIGVAFGLLEEQGRQYRLTESGGRSIESGTVFVPERGAWRLWTSKDPLLPSPILRIDAWEEAESALDETHNREKERRFVMLPDWIRGAQGMEMKPPASGDGATIRVDTLEETSEEVEADSNLKLIWNIGDNRLRLLGTLDGAKVDSQLPAPDVVSDEIWEALLDSEGLSDDWDPRRRVLRLCFEHTSDVERETMSRNLEFAEPFVPDFGLFDAITVSGTAIAARSGADAQWWSEWRLNARIGDFATKERYGTWWNEASTPFAEYRPERPARAELAVSNWASSADRPSLRAWHLIAAEDWGV